MAVGKGSIKRAAKAVDSSVAAAPAKEVVEAIAGKEPAEKKPAARKTPVRKTAAKKAPAKKTAEKAPEKNAPVGIGTALPTYLL